MLFRSLGGRPQLAAALAADGIDEWLTVMSGPLSGRPDPRLRALAEGSALRVRAADEGLAGPGDWVVAHQGGAVSVSPGPGPARPGPAGVTITGPAADLLLVLVRRLPPAAVTVHGDPAVLGRWLAGTSF